MSSWVKACRMKDIPANAGGCVIIKGQHIAIFNYADGKEWYALPNVCPHKQQSVLSRGLIGDDDEEPKVACPLHKNTFSLKTGKNLSGNSKYDLEPIEIRIEGDDIFLNININGPSHPLA